MKKLKQYMQPCCLKTVTVLLERDFLEGSVNKNLSVKTTEQEVKEYDFSNSGLGNQGTGFNSSWD